MKLSSLKNKKILILGFQEEGIDTLLFLQKNVEYLLLGIADGKEYDLIDKEIKKEIRGDVIKHFGKNYLSCLQDYDIIIKTPGIPLSLIKQNENQIITSQSDIFLSNCKGKVIGVTGTKGKSTTCSLLHEVLKKAGLNSFLVGNIGKPVLFFLESSKADDFFVYELSSFQLQTATKSPHISIFLNIYKDHLDKHKDFQEYLDSKKKITLFQNENDFFIYNKEDKAVSNIAGDTRAKKIPFIYDDFSSPVLEVVKILGINENFIKEVLVDFKAPPHRIEYIGNFKEIDFYDDSAATIPEATIRAINKIKNLQTIIIGGSSKGSDTSFLIDEINKSSIKNVIILRCEECYLNKGIKGKNVFTVDSMREAVDVSFKETEEGFACALSPGFASFNMFENYKERGNIFKNLVKEY